MEDAIFNITDKWAGYIIQQVRSREDYRKVRDFERADNVRQNLKTLFGIELTDSPTGVKIESIPLHKRLTELSKSV